MSKTYLITIFLSVLVVLRVGADSYEGYIFDKITGDPLVFAHICDKNGKLLGQSNEKGYFSIDCQKDDSVRIKASFVGYKLYAMAFPLKSSQILIAMSPELQNLEDIGVLAVR